MNLMGFRSARRLIGTSLIVALVGWSPGRAAEETARLECGIDALYILLRLEGQKPSYGQLQNALPITNSKGHSMAELQDAAALFGLRLDGLQLNRRAEVLDQPMIGFLQSPSKGHFVVLRPVGTTGTMVQIIDPPNAPWIGDLNRITSKKVWTGRVLVPHKPWFARILTPLSLGSAALAVLLVVVSRLPRGRRFSLPVQSPA